MDNTVYKENTLDGVLTPELKFIKQSALRAFWLWVESNQEKDDIVLLTKLKHLKAQYKAQQKQKAAD